MPNPGKELQFAEIDIASGSIQMHYTKVPNMILGKFAKSENMLYVTGSKMPGTLRQMCSAYLMCTVYLFNPIRAFKADPLAVGVDLNTSRPTRMEGSFKGFSANIATSSNNDGSIEVIYKNILSKKESSILKFDVVKDKSTNISEVLIDRDLNMNSAAIVHHKNKKFILGGFGTRGKKQNWAALASSSYTNGVYFGDITDEKKPEYRYYDFSEIESVRQLQEDLYESRSTLGKLFSKKKTGLSEIKQMMLLHEPVVIDDEIHFRAESFTPTYQYYTTTDAQGNTTTQAVFDGYLYLGFTMVSFDEEGNVLWDISFRTGELKSFILKETVRVMRDDYGDYVFMYSNGFEIIQRRIEGNEVTEIVDEVLSDEGEEIRRSYDQDMDYWYDNYYIAYGSQKLKEEGSGLFGGKRKTFFLSKIEYTD